MSTTDWDSTLQRAYALAADVHKGQQYGPLPYLYHVSGVAYAVAKLGRPAQTVALLHDVLEDSDMTEEALRQHFPGRVVDAVVLLTHQNGASYTEYMQNIVPPVEEGVRYYATAAQESAMVVKYADMAFNLRHQPSARKRQTYIYWMQMIRDWHNAHGVHTRLEAIL